MRLIIPANFPVELRRPAGSTVTLLNQDASAVDVYTDSDRGRLLASLPGAVPAGTKIAATTGSLQIVNFSGVQYFRAATATTLEVQP